MINSCYVDSSGWRFKVAPMRNRKKFKIMTCPPNLKNGWRNYSVWHTDMDYSLAVKMMELFIRDKGLKELKKLSCSEQGQL